MRVKPVDPSAVIRDPHTRRPLPAEGGNVPDSHFWRRRLRDGAVVIIVEQPAPVRPIVPPPVVRRPAGPTGFEPLSPLTTRDTNKG